MLSTDRIRLESKPREEFQVPDSPSIEHKYESAMCCPRLEKSFGTASVALATPISTVTATIKNLTSLFVDSTFSLVHP